jgi:hypothetical protein
VFVKMSTLVDGFTAQIITSDADWYYGDPWFRQLSSVKPRYIDVIGTADGLFACIIKPGMQ